MKRHAKFALLAGVAVFAAGAATAQTVDAYGVEQPERGVTGIGVNEAAPPEVLREGGYIPPTELQRRIHEGTVDSGVHIRDAIPAIGAGARASAGASGAAGFTVAQLDDADVVTRDGLEIGEVEGVLLDTAGKPAAVLVELEDDVFGRERLIVIELTELSAQPARKYLNIWSDRIDLVTDRPLSWFDTAPEWRDSPYFGAPMASR